MAAARSNTWLSLKTLKGVGLWWSSSSTLSLNSNICPTIVQVRNKGQMSRLKAPPEPKAQDRWVKTSKSQTLSEEKPKQNYSAAFLLRVPQDDVWIRCHYPVQPLPLDECLIRHRENADPSMGDNLEGFVYADMELDMKTSKKTKFMPAIKGTILLPHLFEQPVVKQKIAVFCKGEEDLLLAKSLGADHVGCEDLVKEVQSGLIKRDDIDIVICTTDTITDMIPIRAILRDKFPNKARGNVGSNLEQMWKLHTQGVTYASHKVTDSVSRVQVPVGQLKMSISQLSENFMAYVDALCKGRPKNLGPLIIQVVFVAPPSTERFVLKTEDYVPGHEKKQQTVQQDEEEDSDEEEETARRS